MTKVAKKAATKTAKKSTAKVAKKSTKTVATKADVKAAKEVQTKRAPNPIMEKLIALMLRKEGATIADFQGVEGFAIPSMAVVKAAQRAGYKAEASKQPGERTVYKAVRP
jgi:hypothetical protein